MRNPVILEDLQYITNQSLPWTRFKNKTVLISGAAGFLPSYMVEVLLFLNETQDLNIRIIALVRTLDKARHKFHHALNREDLIIRKQDICHPFDVEEKIDFVIHAASFATPKVFAEDPVGTILPNSVGTKNMLEIAQRHQVENFLFFSTTGVYGFLPADAYPVPENRFGALDCMDVSACYLESKRMGENLCACWHHQYGLPVNIVRPAITYGPGLDLEGGRSFEDFVACIVHNRDIELYSDGQVIRNFCYSADATLGFFLVLLKGANGAAYNIATDHEITIRALADYLTADVFPERGLKVVLNYDESRNYMRTQFSRTTVDISKARKLGWHLAFPIDEGFKRVVRSFECAPSPEKGQAE